MPSLVHATYDHLGGGNFTAEVAEATETYRLERDDDDDTPVTEALLLQYLKDFVGFTSIFGGGGDAGPAVNGMMARIPPRSHPVFKNLFATNVSVRPFPPTYEDREYDDTGLEAPPPGAGYAFYDSWELVVKFQQRPYALLNDDVIAGNGNLLNWWDTDGTPVASTAWPEWLRWVESEFSPRPSDVLRWKKGQMCLQKADQKIPYTALPNVTLPNFDLKLYWYAVPLRYIMSADSILFNRRNTVNQLPITLDGRPYAPGELLYTGFTSSRFTPAFSVPTPWGGLAAGNPFHTSAGKLCNLILSFVGTSGRVATDLPAYIDPGTFQSTLNHSHLASGHNLFLHHNDRNWYYARSVPMPPADPGDQSLWFPQFPSFPTQLLFKDPDVGELD